MSLQLQCSSANFIWVHFAICTKWVGSVQFIITSTLYLPQRVVPSILGRDAIRSYCMNSDV